MSTTMYSFETVTATFSHPGVGQFVASGQGIGSITLTMTTDRTTHDVAADGSIMISKVPGKNGTIALAIQQVSKLNQWLLKLYNHLETAPATNWANTTLVIRSQIMQDMITCYGVSFQKLPDRPYQAQGQQVTWQLMSAEIIQEVA